MNLFKEIGAATQHFAGHLRAASARYNRRHFCGSVIFLPLGNIIATFSYFPIFICYPSEKK
jgi:hypothetical protein